MITNNKTTTQEQNLLRSWGRMSTLKRLENINKRLGIKLKELIMIGNLFFQVRYNFRPSEIGALVNTIKKIQEINELKTETLNIITCLEN